MKKISIFLTLAALVTLISACSSLRFPGVYRIAIAQGNYIEEEMVAELTKGMTRRQVIYVLGSPLVKDTFNQDQWDYYYNVSRNSKSLVDHRFTVFFEDDLLSHWEGDYIASKKETTESENEALEATEKKNAAKF